MYKSLESLNINPKIPPRPFADAGLDYDVHAQRRLAFKASGDFAETFYSTTVRNARCAFFQQEAPLNTLPVCAGPRYARRDVPASLAPSGSAQGSGSRS